MQPPLSAVDGQNVRRIKWEDIALGTVLSHKNLRYIEKVNCCRAVGWARRTGLAERNATIFFRLTKSIMLSQNIVKSRRFARGVAKKKTATVVSLSNYVLYSCFGNITALKRLSITMFFVCVYSAEKVKLALGDNQRKDTCFQFL